MGAAGGIIVLVLGMVFKTGKPINAIMSYTPFFCVIAGMMLVALFVFKLTVNEPKLAAQMEEDTKKYGIEDTPDEETANSGSRKLSRKEFISLILILASVALWYMGYNAVTSKYSVYASTVLNLDYNLTLMIATGAAIVCYVPAGMLATKFGRKKTILAGIILLGSAFFIASFARNGSPAWMMNGIFIMAGMGWATINVNSYPMVVELSRGGDVGKYTGFYYTASMAAQTITPVISGAFMEIKMTSLFVYATIMVFSAFITMFFVKHGDAKQIVSGENK
jgi:Na+/melibiose symporter-like transporter